MVEKYNNLLTDRICGNNYYKKLLCSTSNYNALIFYAALRIFSKINSFQICYLDEMFALTCNTPIISHVIRDMPTIHHVIHDAPTIHHLIIPRHTHHTSCDH